MPLSRLPGRNWRLPARLTAVARQSVPGRRLLSARPVESQKPFYVTSPIFYVNASAHIGHLYTMVMADVLKRWQGLKQRQAILLTGVDEHGLKIQKAAEAHGIPPQQFCDTGARNFMDLAAAGMIDYDHFVRTSDPAHRQAVQYVWQQLYDRGLIYLANHQGWYSVSDETFYPSLQVEPALDRRTGRKFMASIETGREVEWAEEKNYHFRLSRFSQVLLDHYDRNPGFVTPLSRRNALYSEIQQGLSDLSISRPANRLTWGVPVPGDDSQTVYVWLDALMCYLVQTGYPWASGQPGLSGWAPDVQVIGKDISRFHCVYWPAFLTALGVDLPTRIVTHGHWTLGRKKMSKSDGNVVDPFFSLSRFGVDVVRFFMIHDGGIDYDPEYNNDLITQTYNDVLRSVVGNMCGRVVKSRLWTVADVVDRTLGPQGRLPDFDADDRAFVHTIEQTAAQVRARMDEADSRAAIEAIVAMLRETNKYFHNAAPWQLIPKGTTLTTAQLDEKTTTKVESVVLLAAEALRIGSIFLQMVMPTKAAEMLDLLQVKPDRRTAADAVLFQDSQYGRATILADKTAGILFPPLVTDE